jgi:hypothetical protein
MGTLWICGSTLRNRIRNEDISNICEIRDIIRRVEVRRRAWRDHVNKMDDNRLTKITENGKPDLPRSAGRPLKC